MSFRVTVSEKDNVVKIQTVHILVDGDMAMHKSFELLERKKNNKKQENSKRIK
jgi:hypothetical protein